ncbi:MAG: DEAD/DEAH box helicase [Rhodobacteraceae bacterium]|nr:DEAD/DEAH box helicase [Paracoccaceae bacterium]
MTKFSDLNLDEKVLKAIAETGYETPTPIQAEAIPHAIMGRDVLGIAQTGTGKTASFTLPMITILAQGRARARMPRSLILCPTRELAAQVAENFENYGKYHKLSMALLIGGVSFKDQDRLIDRGVDVLIATPGRLLDHHERGKLMLTGVQVMVVDEADRMLDMGFIPDLERIFKLTPFTRQTLFFSATMAPEITRITEEFLHNPVRVEVARQATTSETITQVVCEHTPSRRDSAAKEKRDLLRAIMKGEGEALTNAIIFCNRKVDVDIVAKSLKKHGLDANPIHGDLEQSMRMKILTAFRDGELKFLVASDVAARGLDIPNVSHVFNFDVPIHAEDYVHRIGRTGRAGRSGKAITLCVPSNKKHLDAIEELVKTKIDRMENPLQKAKAAPAPAKVEEAPAPEKAEKPQRTRAPRKEREEQPKREHNRQEGNRRNERRNNDNRGDNRQNNRNNNRNDNRRGPMGMGDHMPAFLTREFLPMPDEAPETVQEKPKRTRKPKAEPEVVIEAVVEAPAVVEATPEAVTEAPAEKPKRKPRKSATAVVEATPEAQPEEKPKKRRTRTKAPAPEMVEEPKSEEAPAKPKRKRRTKAQIEADKAAAEAAGEPVKPKRKPRKKAAPKTKEPAVAEAPKVEEPALAEKPKKRARITAPAPSAE